MIDVSDGLVADLGHIAQGSGVGYELATVPVASGATLAEALGGGDDYVLVFAAPPGADIAGAFDAAGLSPPARLGTCVAGPNVRRLGGEPLAAGGWEHRL
jgi:thiamine-monophosphate kinase